jgi:primosomal protein N' (replication factor Y)
VAVARVALPVAAFAAFDYWIPDGLVVGRGALVRVRLAGRALAGVVVDVVPTSAVAREKLQPLAELRDDLPALPEDLLGLAEFVARYYQEPLGLVLAQMLPPLVALPPRTLPSRRIVTALRLTESGRIALPAALARAPRGRALYDKWKAASESILAANAFAALAPHLKNAVRRWEAAGWVEAVVAEPVARATDDGRRAPDGPLNPDQVRAVTAVVDAAGSFAPFLLQGITGSGKTEVYLAAAAACIAAGGQALILVPEINLTPQFLQRINAALPTVRTVTLHSRLPASERLRSWCRAAAGDVDLVLGTRLAIFAPLPRLGLIVVDEEHDPSFKQQDGVRYHGRDVAVWRARQRAVPVVLGSATPSLESLVHAQQGRYRWLKLPLRAVVPARLPSFTFVPSRDPAALEGIGAPLVAALAARLERGEQSLVFVNRRGFALSLLCSACGWQAGCPRCSARLVVHRETLDLRCHHCGHVERLARSCPECGNVDLLPLGHGTQRLERALADRFPDARIARIDRDSTRRKGAFAAIRDRVHEGDVDILVGTQMLAKGHDFPRLTLVGVVGADNALYSGDFRATERLAALLFQVSGRAGRADLPGEVIVQTDFPAHPLARALAAHDYESFAEALLAERRAASLPPFAYLALLVAEAPRRDAVDAFLAAASEAGRAAAHTTAAAVEVFLPVPASLPRRAGLERGQVLAQAIERGAMQRFLPHWRDAVAALPGRRVRWALDVDPLGFS